MFEHEREYLRLMLEKMGDEELGARVRACAHAALQSGSDITVKELAELLGFQSFSAEAVVRALESLRQDGRGHRQ